VIISENTMKAVRDRIKAVELPKVRVKGKQAS